MCKSTTGTVLCAALAAAGLLFGCVDPEQGETGAYGSPCRSAFGSLLLCGRELGGADSVLAPGEDEFTCEDACRQIAACFGEVGESDIQECISECTVEATPALLECIKDNGCNLEACSTQG